MSVLVRLTGTGHTAASTTDDAILRINDKTVTNTIATDTGDKTYLRDSSSVSLARS